MESIVMATPSGVRFKSRLRSAASNFLNRSNKNRHQNANNRNSNASKTAGARSHTAKVYSLRNNRSNVNAPIANNNNDGDEASTSASTSSINNLCRGPFTREVYNAISGRLGQTPNIPGDSVQALFNDMRLYPSKQQVSDMLQCARQCSPRNGASYLTFGEFCLFTREMQNHSRIRRPSQKIKKCTSNCEVFLGGSCNPTTWRTDTAIPELQKHGISYYNPQVPMWAPELVAEEHNAKQSASVLLYVVDSQTRSVGGMIEVAFLIATGRCVVLVACPYSLGQSIMGEVISRKECFDLVEGQTALLALVKSKGITVHNNLSMAIQCTTRLLRNPSVNNGMTAEEQITFKLRKLREAFDFYDRNRTGELTLEEIVNAYYMLMNRNIERCAVLNYLHTTNNVDQTQLRYSFEHFCALVAEFGADACENYTTNGWASQPLQRQYSRNNNFDDVSRQITRMNDDNESYHQKRGPNRDRYLADIFLGGSSRASVAWREHAIPLIKRHELTYYNPSVREMDSMTRFDNSFYHNANENDCDEVLSESMVLQWRRVIDRSRVLLFVITNDTRSLTTMILAAYYIGLGRDVILCVQHLGDDSVVGNEKLSKQAIKDYNRGRVYLTDLAKRKHVPVFENITKAVQCAIEKCRHR